jgi:hypothetical protein
MADGPSHPLMPYRLDELGWLQFDRLCSLLMRVESGLADLQWRGHSDRIRVASVDSSLSLDHHGIRMQGPATVAAVWVRNYSSGLARLSDLANRVDSLFVEAGRPVAGPLLVLTNLSTADASAALRERPLAQLSQLVVIGAEELAASLDRSAALRAALPSVLGVRDLAPLIDDEALSRSSFDVARAQELARVFWATHAYERARAVLARHRFVVLTGPPEMGKTAIAQMLALAHMTDGWEAHECNDPEQVWQLFDRGRRQLFVADDAFGSTEYRPDAAERWARGLGRLLAMLDSHHWLIWTSRPAPLKAGLRRVQRERGSERFPAPGEVLVDASHLDLAEKTLILFRHAKSADANPNARRLVRSAALSIVEHPHFTPERIRRFVTERLRELPYLAVGETTALGEAQLVRLVENELASPTDAMRTSFAALEPEHRELLIALLDAPAGLIDERELAATVRRHHAGGLSHPPGELIDRLTDHFLRITPLGIGWVHPSWRDLVIEKLRSDPAARRRFLAACGIHGVTLALSAEGGVAGERTLPLLISDGDWDELGGRVRDLLRELEDQELARLLLELAAALTAILDPAQTREAQSLATYLVNATRHAWDRACRPLPVALLEAWYALNKRVPEPAEAPGLAPTWAELHPGSLLLDRPDRSELVRADDWLALARTLSKHDRNALRALGFFDRDRDLLERMIVTLTRTTSDDELRPLSEAVLLRIEELVPDLATGAQSAIEIARLVEEMERKKWWVPQDIPAPPSTEPVTVSSSEFRRDDVDRVLRDL